MGYYSTNAPILMDGAIFYQGTKLHAHRYQQDIFSFNINDNTDELLTFGGGDDQLMAASPSRILVRRYTEGRGDYHAVLDRAGNLLTELDIANDDYQLLDENRLLSGEPSFDGKYLISMTEDDHSTVYLTDFDAGFVHKIATQLSHRMVGFPKLWQDGVLFAGNRGTNDIEDVRIFFSDAYGQFFQISSGNEQVENFAVDNGKLYWVTNKGVYVRDGVIGEVKKIYHGEGCISLDAADGMAVFGCRADFNHSSYRRAATALYLYNGAETLNILSPSPARYAVYPRVSSVGVVWMEVDDIAKLCSGSFADNEDIVYYDIATQKHLSLGHTRAPCLCCMWPIWPKLSIQENIVVWNIIETRYQQYNTVMGLAYAVITPETNCDE